ncbi:MAG: PilZ domain-containing protein [Thermodesulfobacteriota bacterium]
MNNMNERRKYSLRPESVNLVYFAVYNQENILVQQGMGKTLNISEGGILLETYEKISEQGSIYLSLGFKDETVDVKAEIAHMKVKKENIYHTGLSFSDVSEKKDKIKKYIKIFNEQKVGADNV